MEIDLFIISPTFSSGVNSDSRFSTRSLFDSVGSWNGYFSCADNDAAIIAAIVKVRSLFILNVFLMVHAAKIQNNSKWQKWLLDFLKYLLHPIYRLCDSFRIFAPEII